MTTERKPLGVRKAIKAIMEEKNLKHTEALRFLNQIPLKERNELIEKYNTRLGESK